MKRKQGIYLVLHNIRSAHNVGSIFRTADAVGVSKIYLCGITPVPGTGDSKLQVPNSKKFINSKLQIKTDKVAKTALGAEKTMPWEYHTQTARLLRKLKRKNGKLKIIALEEFDRLTASKLKVKNIFKFKPNFPLVLVVGNEVKGVNKKILSLADKIVEIPMYGKKESLNVAAAVGIALYHLKNQMVNK